MSESADNQAALQANVEKRMLELKDRSEPVIVHVLKAKAG